MIGQDTKIGETLITPDVVIESRHDPSIRLYHKLYEAVKVLADDAFVVTAFFTDREKQGIAIWAR